MGISASSSTDNKHDKTHKRRIGDIPPPTLLQVTTTEAAERSAHSLPMGNSRTLPPSSSSCFSKPTAPICERTPEERHAVSANRQAVLSLQEELSTAVSGDDALPIPPLRRITKNEGREGTAEPMLRWQKESSRFLNGALPSRRATSMQRPLRSSLVASSGGQSALLHKPSSCVATDAANRGELHSPKGFALQTQLPLECPVGHTSDTESLLSLCTNLSTCSTAVIDSTRHSPSASPLSQDTLRATQARSLTRDTCERHAVAPGYCLPAMPAVTGALTGEHPQGPCVEARPDNLPENAESSFSPSTSSSATWCLPCQMESSLSFPKCDGDAEERSSILHDTRNELAALEVATKVSEWQLEGVCKHPIRPLSLPPSAWEEEGFAASLPCTSQNRSSSLEGCDLLQSSQYSNRDDEWEGRDACPELGGTHPSPYRQFHTKSRQERSGRNTLTALWKERAIPVARRPASAGSGSQRHRGIPDRRLHPPSANSGEDLCHRSPLVASLIASPACDDALVREPARSIFTTAELVPSCDVQDTSDTDPASSATGTPSTDEECIGLGVTAAAHCAPKRTFLSAQHSPISNFTFREVVDTNDAKLRPPCMPGKRGAFLNRRSPAVVSPSPRLPAASDGPWWNRNIRPAAILHDRDETNEDGIWFSSTMPPLNTVGLNALTRCDDSAGDESSRQAVGGGPGSSGTSSCPSDKGLPIPLRPADDVLENEDESVGLNSQSQPADDMLASMSAHSTSVGGDAVLLAVLLEVFVVAEANRRAQIEEAEGDLFSRLLTQMERPIAGDASCAERGDGPTVHDRTNRPEGEAPHAVTVLSPDGVSCVSTGSRTAEGGCVSTTGKGVAHLLPVSCENRPLCHKPHTDVCAVVESNDLLVRADSRYGSLQGSSLSAHFTDAPVMDDGVDMAMRRWTAVRSTEGAHACCYRVDGRTPSDAVASAALYEVSSKSYSGTGSACERRGSLRPSRSGGNADDGSPGFLTGYYNFMQVEQATGEGGDATFAADTPGITAPLTSFLADMSESAEGGVTHPGHTVDLPLKASSATSSPRRGDVSLSGGAEDKDLEPTTGALAAVINHDTCAKENVHEGSQWRRPRLISPSPPSPAPLPVSFTVNTPGGRAGDSQFNMSDRTDTSPSPVTAASRHTLLRPHAASSASPAPIECHCVGGSVRSSSVPLAQHGWHRRSDICRWCDAPYAFSPVCPVACQSHHHLQTLRREEKRAKKEARQLLREGSIQEAVRLLSSSGLCGPTDALMPRLSRAAIMPIKSPSPRPAHPLPGPPLTPMDAELRRVPSSTELHYL